MYSPRAYLRDDPHEHGILPHRAQVRARRLEAQQPLGRHDDQRLAELTVYLTWEGQGAMNKNQKIRQVHIAGRQMCATPNRIYC